MISVCEKQSNCLIAGLLLILMQMAGAIAAMEKSYNVYQYKEGKFFQEKARQSSLWYYQKNKNQVHAVELKNQNIIALIYGRTIDENVAELFKAAYAAGKIIRGG